jgi:hypothetical protein
MADLIVLGVSSENGNNSFGTFYEGALTAGRPSDEIDLAVFEYVQAAGYGEWMPLVSEDDGFALAERWLEHPRRRGR